jgi:DNA-directed RNA polymerase specialized sigma54-like protein
MQFQIPSSRHDPANVLELELEAEIELLELSTVELTTEVAEVRVIGALLIEPAHLVM